MIWNSRKSTYYDKGRKAYGFGDIIPESVLKSMGQQTFDEYVYSGLIADESDAKDALLEQAKEEKKEVMPPEQSKDDLRKDLFEQAKGYGLKPHPKTGISKLEAMIEDFEALQTLKGEALTLGIDPSDDVGFAELTTLINEKKTENESDS